MRLPRGSGQDEHARSGQDEHARSGQDEHARSGQDEHARSGQDEHARSGQDEHGAVIIVVAFSMVAVVAMAALVIDLAQLRTDRRLNKSVADMSVRAGLGVLNLGPWSGVCRAGDYLRANSPAFSDFDPGSEKWFQLSSPLSSLTSSPCLNTNGPPHNTLCLPGPLNSPRFDTWGRLTATAGGGRFTIEIQSGYTMPDSRFAEDSLSVADTGDPLKGSCDNLVVIARERRTPQLAGVFGQGDRTTTIRSVGRLGNVSTPDYNPALLLLERHGCDVLVTSGANTRVIAQPYLTHPGVLQIDSADDQGGCSSNQAVLNGQATSGGPSIVACSARTLNPTPGCNLATGNRPSRVGVHALNFPHIYGDYVTSDYPGTYGDTEAVPSAQSGRTPLDTLYRQNVSTLDAEAQSVLTGNGGRPPGCSVVVGNTCTGNGRTWLVLQQADCNNVATFFTLVPVRQAAQNIWFNCDLSVQPSVLLPAGLILAGLDSYIVVTGQLHLTTTFAILDPRTIFIGGRAGGNKIGLDIGNGGSLNVNLAAVAQCTLRVGIARPTRMVVGNGSFNMASGARAHLCETFVFMASGYGKVPATNGTEPCSNPCSSYLGTVSIGSGANVDWSAPNRVVGRRPTVADVELTSVPAPISPYEDIGLWTEAGGNTNSIGGGGTTSMAGVFFLGNADAFTLAGNSGANVYLSAQFISTRMKVTGGAVVNLVLSPYDTIAAIVYEMVLVR